ncbi:MAG: STAS/SEC14 domain-containing protein [Verrucomicrobiales bacterium]|nr:STAS/SEC14 domain-containing protein [Verrucomicrobiales bacterium]
MKTIKRGFSVGIDRVGNEIFLTLKAVGKLKHEDYEVITPMIDAAVSGVPHPTINVMIDGTEMEGWEPRAAWDDFRLGVKHGKEFGKIAIFGNKHWQEIAAKVGTWFISGEMKYFESEEEAYEWVAG